MKPLENIIRVLAKPFPRIETRYQYFKILILLSAFVTFFLYVFQPFGIATLESDKLLVCLGFGGMTFLGAAIYEFIVDGLLKLKRKQQKWTFGKWILDNIGIMFTISLANFLFARLLLFGNVQWELFPQMLYGTFMIGVIPLVMLGGFTMFSREKKYQAIANEINRIKKSPENSGQNAKLSVFDIPTHQIQYVEALQNYARIVYINSGDQLKTQTERVTLKGILESTEGSSIIQCHRSFLVNRNAIISVEGNAQGLSLSLSGCDTVIPVSRTHVPLFRDQ